MKDPIIAIKTAIITALGDPMTVSGQTVEVFTDPPQISPNYFVWQQEVTSTDTGSKDNFGSDVQIEVVIVTKDAAQISGSLLLDQISNEVLITLVNRGVGLTDASGDFNIFSIMLVGISSGRQLVQNKMEYEKKLRLLIKCQQN